MKVKLNLNERLILMRLLPRKEDLITLRLIRKAMKVLEVKEEEFPDYDIKPNENGSQSWDLKKAESVEKEFELGEVVSIIIIKMLKEMAERKTLELSHLSLYDKFVEEEKA